MPTFRTGISKRSLEEIEAALQTSLRKQAQALAYDVRDMIKARIPPGNSISAGMPATFPGYAATGRLRGWIRASKIKENPTYGRFTVTVGLPENAPKKVRMYFWVHEYGRTIRARQSGYLLFQIEGKWVKVKQVRIREKRFFRSGWDDARRQFPQLVYKHVRPRWPS